MSRNPPTDESPTETELLATLEDKAAIITLIWDCGCSPSEALDYIAVRHWGHPQQTWAETRDVSRQAVNNNIRKAESKVAMKDS